MDDGSKFGEKPPAEIDPSIGPPQPDGSAFASSELAPIPDPGVQWNQQAAYDAELPPVPDPVGAPVPMHTADLVDPNVPLGQIGDITLFATHISTPAGTAPIEGLTWTMRDQTVTTETISTVGVILAILFFWVCLLGLLFLLMKDRKIQGGVEVSVQGANFFHLTQIPISNPAQIAEIRRWVDYGRALSAAR